MTLFNIIKDCINGSKITRQAWREGLHLTYENGELRPDGMDGTNIGINNLLSFSDINADDWYIIKNLSYLGDIIKLIDYSLLNRSLCRVLENSGEVEKYIFINKVLYKQTSPNQTESVPINISMFKEKQWYIE